MENFAVILTGYSENEFKRLGHDENLRCCYRCKRTEQDRSAVIIEEGVMFQGLKLLPLAVQVKEEGTTITVKFNICVECYLLLRAERDDSGKRLPMEIFEREGLI